MNHTLNQDQNRHLSIDLRSHLPQPSSSTKLTQYASPAGSIAIPAAPEAHNLCVWHSLTATALAALETVTVTATVNSQSIAID